MGVVKEKSDSRLLLLPRASASASASLPKSGPRSLSSLLRLLFGFFLNPWLLLMLMDGRGRVDGWMEPVHRSPPAYCRQTDTPISVLAVGGQSRFDSNGPACVSRLAGQVAKHRGLVPAHDLQSDGQHLNVRADHASFFCSFLVFGC